MRCAVLIVVLAVALGVAPLRASAAATALYYEGQFLSDTAIQWNVYPLDRGEPAIWTLRLTDTKPRPESGIEWSLPFLQSGTLAGFDLSPTAPSSFSGPLFFDLVFAIEFPASDPGGGRLFSAVVVPAAAEAEGLLLVAEVDTTSGRAINHLGFTSPFRIEMPQLTLLAVAPGFQLSFVVDVTGGLTADDPLLSMRVDGELVPVPEPPALLLLMMGLAASAWRARRKRESSSGG